VTREVWAECWTADGLDERHADRTLSALLRELVGWAEAVEREPVGTLHLSTSPQRDPGDVLRHHRALLVFDPPAFDPSKDVTP
jgi:hypothetical protein